MYCNRICNLLYILALQHIHMSKCLNSISYLVCYIIFLLNCYKNIDILWHHTLARACSPMDKKFLNIFISCYLYIFIYYWKTYFLFHDTIAFTFHVLLYSNNFLFFECECSVIILYDRNLWLTNLSRELN